MHRAFGLSRKNRVFGLSHFIGLRLDGTMRQHLTKYDIVR